MLRTVGLHPVVTGIVLVAATLTALAVLRFRDRILTLHSVMIRFLVILLLLGVKAMSFDIPTALIENVLVERADPSRSFDASPLLDWRTRSLWQSILCAHAAPAPKLVICKGEEGTRHHLESIFLINVAITLALFVWAATLLRDSLDIRGQTRSATLAFLTARTIVVLGLAIVLLALPYQYGELVVSTSFNEVVLHFADNDPAENPPPPIMPAGTAVPAPQPADERQDRAEALHSAHDVEWLRHHRVAAP